MNSLSTSIPVAGSVSHQPAPSTTKSLKRKISRPALRLISTNGLSHDSWLS